MQKGNRGVEEMLVRREGLSLPAAKLYILSQEIMYKELMKMGREEEAEIIAEEMFELESQGEVLLQTICNAQ